MSVRTGYSGSIYASTAYAAADTYYPCTVFTMNYGADSVRLTLTNTVANAGTVTLKAEISNGASTPVYSQYGAEITVAMTSGDVKSILLPYRFCGGDKVRVSFKASSVASNPKLAIDCLAYLAVNNLIDGERTQLVSNSVADTVLSLTEDSADTIMITGSASGYIVRTPDATSMPVGWTRRIKNVSSEFVEINNSATTPTLFELLGPGCTAEITLTAASAAGTWSATKTKTDPSFGSDYEYDFFGYTAEEWTPSAGTGSSIVYTGVATLGTLSPYGVIGYAVQSTGTTEPVIHHSYVKQPVNIGSGAKLFRHRLLMLQAPTGAQDFTYEIGLFATLNAAEAANGLILRCPTNASGFTKWYAESYGASTPTVVDSNISVAAYVAVDGIILVNSVANRVDYYIGAVKVATITTNIPATSVSMYPGFKVVKTVGTTNCQFALDYANHVHCTSAKR